MISQRVGVVEGDGSRGPVFNRARARYRSLIVVGEKRGERTNDNEHVHD